MKPKVGQTVIAPRDLMLSRITCGEEYEVFSHGEEGYYVKNPKSVIGMAYVLYSDNWPIKKEPVRCPIAVGVAMLILMILIILLR